MRNYTRLMVFILGSLALASTSCRDGATPTEPAAPPAWTFCVATGAPCEFIGLRDVRLGAANGPYVQQTVYHTVPCASYGFNDQDPAPGQPLHCDYGPMKTRTLNNPTPGMAGMPATVTVGLGSPGVSGQLIRATGNQPAPSGSGSFRTTCSVTNFAFDDPMVYPGQPGASHLHVFFGNAGINANSTPETVAANGNSSCRGGTLNRTGYWAPAVFDRRNGQVQMPDEGIFYYKTGYNIDPTVVKPFPAGLRMIAGDKLATTAQDNVSWYCRDSGASVGGSIPTSCAIGDAVRLAILFPQCWDGIHLDSPDHKSHMSYPDYRNPPDVSTCPATHPVTLPAITEHFDYPITQGSAPAFWRLSSDMYSSSLKGGFSAHADWMNGWDSTTMSTIVTQCLNKSVDCGIGSIGDGTELFY